MIVPRFVIVSVLAVASSAGLLPLPRNNASICCNALYQSLPSVVSYPLSLTYINEQVGLGNAGYYTAQESDLTPSCRVTPTSTAQVAQAIAIAAQYQCQFAIRSGGHTAFAGSANIGSEGFAIDMSSMNSVQLSADQSTVAIGTGARWGDVYTPLDQLNLSIAGGRETPVGVGGLTLGGGKSFFSDKVGFVCDGLHSVELVIASGTILQVSNTSFPDIFRAIKGGSNNFGVITTFTFNTFSQGKLWGGFNFNLASSAPQQFTALGNYLAAPASTSDGIEAIIAYVNEGGIELFTNFFTNIFPTPTVPPVLQEFAAITPSLSQTFRVDNLSSFTNELSTGQSSGSRFLWSTFTVRNSVAFYNASYALFRQTFNPLFLNSSVTQTTTAWQKLSPSMLSHGCGSNSLGVCAPTGKQPNGGHNLVLVNFAVQWSLASADDAIYGVMQSYLNQMVAIAKQMGVYSPYVYLNYAAPFQTPLQSYGGKNLKAMRNVSRAYDPNGVFQNLVPGGFKLWN